MELKEAPVMKHPKGGFERHEIGVFPMDWNIVPLGSLGKYTKGQGIRKDEVQSNGLPCVRYGELYTAHDDVVRQFHSFITKSVAQQSKRLRHGDLLFAGSGETKAEIGKCAVFIGEEEAYAGSDIVILSLEKGDPLLLGYLMNAPVIVRQKASMGQGDAVVHISAASLAKVMVPLPPTEEEQRAIAKALSDVDALLSGLDALIAKKKAIRQGAMQQLLTGKKRLPGFRTSSENQQFNQTPFGPIPSDWEVPTLRELEAKRWLKLYRGNVISKRDINAHLGAYPIYSSSVHDEGLFGRYGLFMFDEELITWSVDGGGHFFHRPKHRFSVTNVCGYMRISDDRLNYKYLAYQLQHLHSQLQFDYLVKAHPGVIRDAYVIPLPNLDEQTAIATVLTDMDGEIGALEVRRAKTALLKQGMMQELLTGKTRLV